MLTVWSQSKKARALSGEVIEIIGVYGKNVRGLTGIIIIMLSMVREIPAASEHQLRSASLIFILTLMLLVAATHAAAAGTAATDETTSATARAFRLARSGYPDQAVQLLQETLAARPGDLEARLALADILAKNSKSDDAEREFREALHLHPESATAAMALGAFYVSRGSLGAAERVLAEAARDHPKLAEARMQLALVQAGEREYAAAEANLRLVPPPADPAARVRYFRLAASIHSGLGDRPAAARAIEEALRIMPNDEALQLVASVAEAEAGEWRDCIRNLAPLYAKHPTPEEGLILLRAQLAVHQDIVPTLQSLRAFDLPQSQKLALRLRSAEILAAADNHGEAAKEFQEALTISGGHDETLLYDLAVEQYRLAQSDQALATLAPLRAQKDSAEIEDLAGDIEEQRGNPVAAVHNYQTAISLAPGEERYRFSLGAELLKYQTYEPAVSVFEQAAKLFPKSARIYLGLGMVYYLMERHEDSVAAFLRAAELDPGSGQAISYLGGTQLHNALGPVPAAADAICSLADTSKAKPATVTWCGALLFRKAYLAGNQAAAPEIIRRLRTATRLAPDDPVANCSLGNALEWTQQLAEARRAMEICVRLRPDSAEDHYRLSRIDARLGLAQAAAEQAELTRKSNAEKDQHQAMAKKFVYEMLGQPKSTGAK